MDNSTNPVALTRGQRRQIAENDSATLNESQRRHLRATGLLAEADEYWRHPEGAFYLMPLGTEAGKRDKRERVPLGGGKVSVRSEPVQAEADRDCGFCDHTFTPKRAWDRYCKPACFTRAREGQAA